MAGRVPAIQIAAVGAAKTRAFTRIGNDENSDIDLALIRKRRYAAPLASSVRLDTRLRLGLRKVTPT